MIRALFLSIGQLFDRRVAMVFIKSILLTVVLFAAVSVGIWYGMHQLTQAISWWLNGWLGGAEATQAVADIATLTLILLAHWLMFRAIAVGVIGIFADEIVEAVEARHYPQAHAAARDVPLGRSIAMGLGSATRLIVINVLLSPLYIMLLLTGIGTPVAFFLVNSWLLGRDFGDMVAARHMPAGQLKKWRGRTRFKRFALGAFGTGIFFIPGINLLAPVIGAAMAAHAFHQGRK
ncbi:MAG: EI24 domain-containing protein [Sphingomonas sp.]